MAEQQKQPEKKTRYEVYKAQYEASKRGGKPFFPDVIAHDALVALIVVAAIFVLAALFPATLAAPANTAGTAYSPRPEWYFVFVQQFLRLFPGKLEAIGAIVIPLIGIIVLVLLPFFNRGLNRTASKRKGIITAGALVVAFILVLEITGFLFPPTIPVPGVPTPPAGSTFGQLAQDGKTAYNNSCASCHGVNGEGVVAPALWGSRADLKSYGTAQGLLAYISASMPAGSPGSLSHQAYVDILCYILLQGNDVQAGTVFNESQLSGINLK